MRHAIETSLQRHEASRPWLTGNVEIIASVLNAERELHRLVGAGLAEHALWRRETRGRLKPQTRGNRDLAQLFRCKLPLAPPVVHRLPPPLLAALPRNLSPARAGQPAAAEACTSVAWTARRGA